MPESVIVVGTPCKLTYDLSADAWIVAYGAISSAVSTFLEASFMLQGTLALFAQTSAPTGWTKDINFNEHALRVVSGTVSNGGSTDFTSVFTARTLTVAQLPAHTHGVNDPGHSHTYISFELSKPVGIETGMRFALREGGKTVGAGFVKEAE